MFMFTSLTELLVFQYKNKKVTSKKVSVYKDFLKNLTYV